MLAPKQKQCPNLYHESKQRWWILLCCAFNCLCACYIGACTTSMGFRLKDRFGIDSIQYNFIFSCYAAPNIFSPIIGGLVVDYLGVNLALIIFTTFPLVGSMIMVVALLIPNYALFCFGYFTLALGGLNTRLSGAVLLTKWFRSDQQGLVFGIIAVGDSLGSLMDASTTPRLLEDFGLSTAATMGVAAFLQCVRFITALCPSLVERNMRSQNLLPIETTNSPKTLTESFQNFAQFDRIYWLVVLSVATLYPVALSFGNISVLFVQTKWHYSLVDAGNLHMSQCLLNLIVGPVLGYASDRAGRRGHIMIVGALGYAFVYLTLGLTTITPYFAFLSMTFASILFQTSSFPSIGMVVDGALKGSAFGLMLATCSLASTLLPLVVGCILEKYGYTTLLVYFATLCFVSIGFMAALISEDRQTGKRLWTSSVNVLEGVDEDTPLLGQQKSD